MAYPGYPDYYQTDPYGGRSYPAPYPPRDAVAKYGPPRMDYGPPNLPDRRVISSQPRRDPRDGDFPPRDWNSGLFDCTDDVKLCCCVLCNPCYECYLVEKFNESCLNVVFMGGGVTFLALRYKIRAKENIQGSLLEDCLMSTMCHPCLVCQLKRERDSILRAEGRLV